ncbi:hypothetical protein WDU94_005467 [Cyamophila willieti]
MDLSDDEFEDIFSGGAPTPNDPPASPTPSSEKEMSSPPKIPEDVFFPKFSGTRSSSPPLISDESKEGPSNNSSSEKEEFPALQDPSPPAQDSRKRVSDRSDKIKKQIHTPSKDPEITEGFQIMVQKILESNVQLSVSADQICDLIARLKHSQKRQEIINGSNIPLSEVQIVLQEIHANPDTSTNMKARMTRILNSVSSEPKMSLVNVESIS